MLGCDKDHDKVNAKGRLLKNLQRSKEAQRESDKEEGLQEGSFLTDLGKVEPELARKDTSYHECPTHPSYHIHLGDLMSPYLPGTHTYTHN